MTPFEQEWPGDNYVNFAGASRSGALNRRKIFVVIAAKFTVCSIREFGRKRLNWLVYRPSATRTALGFGEIPCIFPC
jgi:hypothetical protein